MCTVGIVHVRFPHALLNGTHHHQVGTGDDIVIPKLAFLVPREETHTRILRIHTTPRMSLQYTLTSLDRSLIIERIEEHPDDNFIDFFIGYIRSAIGELYCVPRHVRLVIRIFDPETGQLIAKRKIKGQILNQHHDPESILPEDGSVPAPARYVLPHGWSPPLRGELSLHPLTWFIMLVLVCFIPIGEVEDGDSYSCPVYMALLFREKVKWTVILGVIFTFLFRKIYNLLLDLELISGSYM